MIKFLFITVFITWNDHTHVFGGNVKTTLNFQFSEPLEGGIGFNYKKSIKGSEY